MNCDPIARWYRWLEYGAFGGALRRRREAFLFELGYPKNVLVLGDGDGRFLQVFAALYPHAKIDAVDVSARMVELARARVPTAQFHLVDARDFAFTKNYDLAVAHFFFNCFESDELAALLARIRTQRWLVSEFLYTRWSRPLIRTLYFLFRLTTGLRVQKLPDHSTALASLGFRLEKQEHAAAGMLVSEEWVHSSNPQI